MPKKLLLKEIEEIINGFFNGKNIEELAKEFSCTKITINRHLKKNIDEEKYKQTVLQNNKKKVNEANISSDLNFTNFNEISYKRDSIDSFSDASFLEIEPLNDEIFNNPQKDLSSIPISEIEFPKTVYMIVDKKIELETKYLKDYPNWGFLSEEELNRKTIEIYLDLKNAKRFCTKEQKIIKVPNTEVFRIVAPILISRGISRIVNSDKLIAL